MKYKFLGLSGQTEITIRGVTFAKNKPVKVDDESLQVKLNGLPYFVKAKTNATYKT
jgi:hypothetical protein